MDGEAFATYVEQVRIPELEEKPGTVVILDNLATHRNAAAKAMREAGCWFLFLPPWTCTGSVPVGWSC